ncbi:ParB-like protein [Microvirga terricola]|uniref:Chromosome partitioning protein ParB n=1 Tax=Microvirga terricola TaxID=2719797 RepID=A0ABX0VF22_9HYPH|nr:ParB-like protein [Microvirga terricola]NIX78078.1 chromosome partitioning protein ParB [Microvirga terricola]
MHDVLEPILKPTLLTDLRPTQITVGMREVEEKRRRWREKGTKGKKGSEFLGTHMIPVVIGPKGRDYILDHHHLALALHLEKVEHVFVSPVADLSALDKEAFWVVLGHKNWMHVYDSDGKLKTHRDIPKSIEGLVDDPYRSLAGELRRIGGYAKDTTLYSEFLWADFLRRNVKRKLVEENFAQASEQALELAKSAQAEYLPGWCGPHSSD